MPSRWSWLLAVWAALIASVVATLVAPNALATGADNLKLSIPSSDDRSARAGEIKIGFLPPLTGPDSVGGLSLTHSLELAVKQINEAGGVNGAMIKLVIIDSQSLPQLAVQALNTLVEKDKVVAIVGPIYSTQTVAMLPGIKKYEIPVLTGATAPSLTVEGNGWLFRMRPAEDLAAQAMVRYLKEDLKVKKAAILHDEGAYGVGGSIALQEHAKQAGIEIVKRIQISKNEKDIKPYFKAMKDAGAEMFVAFATTTPQAGFILTQWSEAGRPLGLLGSVTFATKNAQHIAGAAGEGTLAIVDAVLSNSKEGLKFRADYHSAYGTDVDELYGYPFDAMKVLAKALASIHDLSGKKIREALRKVNDYNGIYGPVRFDSDGNGCHEISVVKIVSQQPVLIRVVKAQ